MFEDAFGHGPHLRLKDLTYNDIKKYVTSKLDNNHGFKVYQQLDSDFSTQLIQNICHISSGVFRWVFLVLHSLLEGLSEGEQLTGLQERLNSLPGDLEELFRKVLDNLGPRHFRRASQLFQINRGTPWPLTLLDMSYADE